MKWFFLLAFMFGVVLATFCIAKLCTVIYRRLQKSET